VPYSLATQRQVCHSTWTPPCQNSLLLSQQIISGVYSCMPNISISVA